MSDYFNILISMIACDFGCGFRFVGICECGCLIHVQTHGGFVMMAMEH